jgi:integrase
MATRRGNQEGSLTHRKDGRWMARVSHEGQRITVYGQTKEEARQKLRGLQRKQDQGFPLVTSQMLLKDYLPQWLQNIRRRVRPKTLVDYEVTVRRHIIPRLGHIRLAKLSPEDVDKAWAGMMRDGASVHAVEYAHRRLSKALNDAMKRNLIYRNPCQAVSPPKVSRKDLYPPDANAIHRFLEVAKNTEYYEALYTSFYTGLRRGEVLALS